VVLGLLGFGYWEAEHFHLAWSKLMEGHPVILGLVLVIIAVMGYVHFLVRERAARAVIDKLKKTINSTVTQEALIKAFRKNTRFFHSVLSIEPAGWGRRTRKRLQQIFLDSNNHIQTLNDMFTNPSGEGEDQAAEVRAA
jgi:hypothetical protein